MQLMFFYMSLYTRARGELHVPNPMISLADLALPTACQHVVAHVAYLSPYSGQRVNRAPTPC